MMPGTSTADVGKNQFIQHQTELEDALRQLAKALGMEHMLTDSPHFFHEFMSYNWDPFEDLCTECKKQSQEIDEQISPLNEHLVNCMDPSLRKVFERYKELLYRKDAVSLDCAFLMGYQSAFQFLLMGLTPAAKVFSEHQRRN